MRLVTIMIVALGWATESEVKEPYWGLGLISASPSGFTDSNI